MEHTIAQNKAPCFGGRAPLFSQHDLLRLVGPLLVEQLLAVTVGMADTMMVSRCGEAAISGVSLVDMINNLIIVLFAALATGGAVVVSQYLGAKEQKHANASSGQLILLSALLGVGVGVFCFVLARPMIRLCYGSIDADVLEAGVLYLRITAVSYPFLAMYNAGAALFRSMGNSKISMQISILMNIINIVGNAVCIFVLGMGVDGVAWPSVLSRAVAAVLILNRCYQKGHMLTVPKTFRLDGRMAKRILGIGIPSAFENSLFQAGRILVVSMISTFGTVQIAANAVANNLDGMGCIPGQAIGLAMITVVGRCVGAGDNEQTVFYTRKLLLWAYISMGIFNGGILLFLKPLVGIYALSGETMALDKTLELAAGMGLATRNCENYIGYAELAGADPEKYLATICHVDVVPVGNGWSQEPFKMQIRDGWMIGRGVADDKGPMVATLYALKFLKEEGVSLRYPIRAMVGDNEETHMNDVEYYIKNYPAPVFCFTPDAEFPVCNGEKGHFGAELVSPVCNGEIKEFEGGVANNAVPDRASALVETDITKLKNAPNITLEPEGNGVRIRGWGKSGHAAMPEGTVNAIGLVVNYLLDNGLCNDAERAYLEALKKLHASTAGTGLGIDCADGPFGPLTIIGGRIFMREGRIVQTMDSRYPTCTNAEKMKEQIKAAIGTGASLEKAEGAEPFYIAADTPAIKACIETYNEVTGENATPFTMGGGTYARHFPYAVSFGPEHEDMVLPEFGGPMHGANEAAPIDKLLEALKIYIIALLRLEEIDF